MPPTSTLSRVPTFSGTTEGVTVATPPILSVTTTPPIPLPPPAVTVNEFPSCTLPAKIVKRIQDLEYVDMAELVPDTWRFHEEESKCCHQNKRPKRGPVTDILLWVECYASMVAVLAPKYPMKVAGLMAYQKTIVRAHRSFAGEGWGTYDSTYRRKASFTKSLDWGQVDFNLYNETFTGRARSINRCRYCLSEHHSSGECVYAPESASHAVPPRLTGRSRYDATRFSTQPCHLYNNRAGNRCRFTPCRFAHTCTECRGSHPASQCRSRPPPPKLPRSESPGGKNRR